MLSISSIEQSADDNLENLAIVAFPLGLSLKSPQLIFEIFFMFLYLRYTSLFCKFTNNY